MFRQVPSPVSGCAGMVRLGSRRFLVEAAADEVDTIVEETERKDRGEAQRRICTGLGDVTPLRRYVQPATYVIKDG